MARVVDQKRYLGTTPDNPFHVEPGVASLTVEQLLIA
jgi:hypothetical protein